MTEFEIHPDLIEIDYDTKGVSVCIKSKKNLMYIFAPALIQHFSQKRFMLMVV